MAERTLTTPGLVPGTSLRDALVRSRLWTAAEAFFFLAFVFSYVYLRVLNVNGQWRPPHTKPPFGTGTVVFALIVVSAAVSAVALRRMRVDDFRAWRGLSLIGLVLGLSAVAMAGWEISNLSFSASDSGYGSVFVGWTVLYALNVLGAMYWLETLVAQAYRHPPSPVPAVEARGDGEREGGGSEDGGGDGERESGANPALSSLAIGAEQFTGFWYFMAAIGALTWVLLYLA